MSAVDFSTRLRRRNHGVENPTTFLRQRFLALQEDYSMYFNKLSRIQIQQLLILLLGVIAFGYATFVFIHVSSSYDLGIHSILNANIVGRPLNVKPEDSHQ